MNDDQRMLGPRLHDQHDPADLTLLSRSLLRRSRWVQRALSPWVQRSLRTVRREPGPDRHIGTALTATHTGAFLSRALAKTERATVLKPGMGSLEPAMIERFATAIADRFPEAEPRYELRPLALDATKIPDMVLAGEPVASHSEPEQGRGFTPFPSLAAFVDAVEARSRQPEAPLTPDQAAPTPQQTATDAHEVRPPSRTLAPTHRVFSRVEEVAPEGAGLPSEGAQLTPPIPVHMEQLAREEVAPRKAAEPQTEPRGMPAQGTEPLPVQGRLEEEELARASVPREVVPSSPALVRRDPEGRAPTQASPPGETVPPSPMSVRRSPEPGLSVRAVEAFQAEVPLAPADRPTAAEGGPSEPEQSMQPPTSPLVQRRPEPRPAAQVEEGWHEDVSPPTLGGTAPVASEIPMTPAAPPALAGKAEALPGQGESPSPLLAQRSLGQHVSESEQPLPPVLRRAPLAETESVAPSAPVLKAPTVSLAAEPQPPEPIRPEGLPSLPPAQRRPERQASDREQPEAPVLPKASLVERKRAEPSGPAFTAPTAPPAVGPKPPEPDRPEELPSLPLAQQLLGQKASEPEQPEASALPKIPLAEMEPVEPSTPVIMAPTAPLAAEPRPLESVQPEERTSLSLVQRQPVSSAPTEERGLEQTSAEIPLPVQGQAVAGMESPPVGQTRALQAQSPVRTAVPPQARTPDQLGEEEAKATGTELPVVGPSRAFTADLCSVPRRVGVPTRESGRDRAKEAQVPGDLARVGRAELPLPLLSPALPARLVQLQPDRTGALAEGISALASESPLPQASILQYASQAPGDVSQATAEEGPDLDRLARQIYPLVKRMLAVERERRAGRWS